MEKRRKQVLAASFLAGAFAVTAGFAVQGHARAAQYRRMLDNTYQHAFTELATAAGEPGVAPPHGWRRASWMSPSER